MDYSIVYIIESTILSALIGACRIGVCNVSLKFNNSNDTEATNSIDIIYNLIIVFKSFGGFINVVEAFIFRYIMSEKINFEGWNILNFRDFELNDSSVNIAM